jgi:hypothetical protein
MLLGFLQSYINVRAHGKLVVNDDFYPLSYGVHLQDISPSNRLHKQLFAMLRTTLAIARPHAGMRNVGER